MVLLAKNMGDQKTMLVELNDAAKSYGLIMNANKTKVMSTTMK